jgi:hypothetical protein
MTLRDEIEEILYTAYGKPKINEHALMSSALISLFLKHLPEKKDEEEMSSSEWIYGKKFIEGWNSCRNEIEGRLL